MKPDPHPDPDPHVHFIKELAELMLRCLLTVNTAARACRLTGRLTLRRSAPANAGRLISRPRHRRQKRKGGAAWR